MKKHKVLVLAFVSFLVSVTPFASEVTEELQQLSYLNQSLFLNLTHSDFEQKNSNEDDTKKFRLSKDKEEIIVNWLKEIFINNQEKIKKQPETGLDMDSLIFEENRPIFPYNIPLSNDKTGALMINRVSRTNDEGVYSYFLSASFKGTSRKGQVISYHPDRGFLIQLKDLINYYKFTKDKKESELYHLKIQNKV